MAPWLHLTLAVIAILLAVASLGWWLRRAREASVRRVDEVLSRHGPARCLAALALLRRLAATQQQATIVSSVAALELPLLQVIPDCPPSLKPELADALEACARVTANRATAKCLMALRNALLNC